MSIDNRAYLKIGERILLSRKRLEMIKKYIRLQVVLAKEGLLYVMRLFEIETDIWKQGC